MEPITPTVRRLILRYGHSADASFSLTEPLDRLGIDILALAQIVTYLEARFGVQIPGLEALRWSNAADVVAFLERERKVVPLED